MKPDDFLKIALRKVSIDDKRKLAAKWIRRCAQDWLRPLLRLVQAPDCSALLDIRLDQAVVRGRDLLLFRSDLEHLSLSPELANYASEAEGRGAALRATKHLMSAIDAALMDDLHLAALTRFITLALRLCVPLVRVGGRTVYQKYSDEVYAWVLHNNFEAEEAEERRLQCRDIMEYMPFRRDEEGFVPMHLDDLEKST